MKQIAQRRTATENLLYENRMSLRDVARRLGCSYEYVRLLANGERPATGKVGIAFMTFIATLQASPRQFGISDATSPSVPCRAEGDFSHNGAAA